MEAPFNLLNEGLRAFKKHVMVLLPHHDDDPRIPYEPEQQFLLGNRWADYALALVFALAFPLVRSLLRKYVYEVGPCLL